MTSTYWTGKAKSTDFNAVGNWDNGVPTATVDAFIVGTLGAPFNVIYGSGVASVLSLTTDFATVTIGGVWRSDLDERQHGQRQRRHLRG